MEQNRKNSFFSQISVFLNQINQFQLFFIFLVLSLIANFFSINGEPIWDDHYYFLSDENFLKSSFIDLWQGSRWPVFKTFLLAQYKIFGRHYLYYHLINIILHAFNGLLLFKLTKKLSLKYALIGCLLFLIHPATVQSVAWMFQVKTLLATTFALLSIYFLISWCLNTKKHNLMLSFVMLVLSFYTKSIYLHLFLFAWIILHFFKIKPSFKWLISSIYLLSSLAYLIFFLSSEQNIKKSEQAKQVQKVKLVKSIDDFSHTDIIKPKTNKIVLDQAKSTLDQIIPDEKRKQDILNFYQAFLLSRGHLTLKKEWDILRERSVLWFKIHAYYLYRIIIPAYMAPIYNRFETKLNLFNVNVLWFGVFALFLLLVCNLYAYKQKFFFYELIILQLTFFASIAPYSGIYLAPYMSITHVSDHHLYSVLVFFIPALVYLFNQVHLPAFLAKWGKWGFLWYGFLLLTYSSYYSQFFKNHQEFYGRVIRYYPTQMVAYFNLAESYRHQNNYEMTAKTLLAGFNAYKAYYPEKVIGAKIPAAILTEKLWHPIFFQHPELDPYFLMIVRYLEYFRDKTN